MDDVDPVGHANIAVGARGGKLSGAIEMVTMFSTGDVGEDADRFIYIGALSLRYDAGQFSPNLAIVTPLDDNGRGDIITIGSTRSSNPVVGGVERDPIL